MVSLTLKLHKTPGQLEYWPGRSLTVHDVLLNLVCVHLELLTMTYLTQLNIQFLSSPELEVLDITCPRNNYIVGRPGDPSGFLTVLRPEDDSAGFPVPRPRSLRVCLPEEDLREFRDSLVQIFQSRTEPILGSTPLRQLTVTESWLPKNSTSRYHVLRCILTPMQLE